jgi:FlaA1/EpsC-like NDP-sugar epimerase
MDYIIHAAATKIVPIAEYNPFECVKTNINGAMNVIDAALNNKVKRVVALSTDKASAPANLYGATKLASDKLFIAANAYSGLSGSIFSVVRYGNVMGSRGSVIPYFCNLVKSGSPITITDTRMTRFMIDLKDGVDLVLRALTLSRGGEIFIRKCPSMSIVDICKAIGGPNYPIETIGIRPGEKLHEQMIGSEDAPMTYEFSDYFKILPNLYDWFKDKHRILEGTKVSEDFLYSSDSNPSWMSEEKLKRWITLNEDKLGFF